jgi:signal recognition particle receptor subunit beta
MVVVNTAQSEINAKIVYYGPALGGKTTNLEQIYERMPSHAKGKMVSMKTRTDRTLFFDFLPLELGDMGGYKTRMLLYTVPGQVYYNATRKLVLKGADAVVFVADSSASKMAENIDSLRNLEENLNELGLTLDTTPWVIQYNKRDLGDAAPLGTLERELNLLRVRSFEAIAAQGVGVYETFQGIAGMLYSRLAERFSPREKRTAQAVETVAEVAAAGRKEREPEESYSEAIDVALREVTAPDRAPEPSVRTAPISEHTAMVLKAAGRPVEHAAADERAARARNDGSIEHVGHREDETLRFESLGTAPIDDAVGRVIDLGRDVSRDAERADGTSSVGIFINDPFREPEPAEARRDPRSEKSTRSGPAMRAETAPRESAPPSASDECVITVPVLLTRSQTRKNIPIKLRLEVQVVDDDDEV